MRLIYRFGESGCSRRVEDQYISIILADEMAFLVRSRKVQCSTILEIVFERSLCIHPHSNCRGVVIRCDCLLNCTFQPGRCNNRLCPDTRREVLDSRWTEASREDGHGHA